MSTPLAVKKEPTQAPTLEPPLEAAGAPVTMHLAPAVIGLAGGPGKKTKAASVAHKPAESVAADADVGGDGQTGAPAVAGLAGGQSKKAKARAKAAAAKSTAVTVAGDAGVGGAAATDAAPSIASELTPEERQANVKTLNADDKESLAAAWGLAVTSAEFVAAVFSQPRYDYFRQLSKEERAFANLKQIKGMKRLAPADVAAHALTQRLRSWETIDKDDHPALAHSWGVAQDSPQFQAALTCAASYEMFLKLAPQHRRIVTAKRIRKGTVLTDDEVKVAEAKRLTILHEEAAAREAEKALLADATKLKASKATFEKEAKDLKVVVKARVDAEIPDFVWEADFDRSIEASRAKVAKGAAGNRQANAVGAQVKADIDLAVKKKAITEYSLRFAGLRLATLTAIKEKVLGDTALTAADFATRAANALSAQRNPTEISTWISWMGLAVYPRYKQLAVQAGLQAHFTISASSLQVPTRVTQTTTAAQLLNSLFRVYTTPGEKFNEAHVSLETGVRTPDNVPKNPHKYWGDGPADHELYFDGANPRWDTLPEAAIRTALNAAMSEIRTALLAKATEVLAQDGLG